MKMFVDAPAIYLCKSPVDFRKSINGLSQIVATQMSASVFSEALFLFTNKSRDKLKILYWDKTGFALWYKRLEKDKFQWPLNQAESQLTLSEFELNRLLDGYAIIGHSPLNIDGLEVA